MGRVESCQGVQSDWIFTPRSCHRVTWIVFSDFRRIFVVNYFGIFLPTLLPCSPSFQGSGSITGIGRWQIAALNSYGEVPDRTLRFRTFYFTFGCISLLLCTEVFSRNFLIPFYFVGHNATSIYLIDAFAYYHRSSVSGMSQESSAR